MRTQFIRYIRYEDDFELDVEDGIIPLIDGDYLEIYDTGYRVLHREWHITSKLLKIFVKKE